MVAPAEQPLITQAFADIRSYEWSSRHVGAATYLLPALIVCLTTGIAMHHPAGGMIAASGAVSSGFGVFHRLTRFRLMPVLLVAVGMAASAWIGTIVGHRYMTASLLTAALWGLGMGAATAIGTEHWWLGMQWVVALCISAAYPSTLWPATERVLLLMGGGVVQAAMVALLWFFTGENFTQSTRGPADSLNCRPEMQSREPFRPVKWVWTQRRQLSPRSVGGRYAYRVATMLTIATYAAHSIHFRSSYWIPMTAAIVVKPDFRSTMARVIGRVTGTVVGAILSTLLLATVHPNSIVLAMLVVAFAWGCFAFVSVNYAIFSVFMTAYVVCQLAFVGLPPPYIAATRAGATLAGGALAAGVHVTSMRFWRVRRAAGQPAGIPVIPDSGVACG